MDINDLVKLLPSGYEQACFDGIGKISDIAFIKKFIQCRDWIKWLTQNILPNPIMHYNKFD